MHWAEGLAIFLPIPLDPIFHGFGERSRPAGAERRCASQAAGDRTWITRLAIMSLVFAA